MYSEQLSNFKSVPLLSVLPLACMRYTAQDESLVVNIAHGKAECAIFVTRISLRAIYFYTNEVAVFQIIVFCVGESKGLTIL